MSANVLQALRNSLNGADLLAGYQVRYFRWTDADLDGAGNFILFRMTGGSGPSNRLLQQRDAQILIAGAPNDPQAADLRMTEILAFLRSETAADANIVRFDPLGAPLGPMYTENGRPIWTINARAWTEDDLWS